jgi:sugar phosphate isomerase/epimerase
MDAYHLQRSGGTPEQITGLAREEIVYVQYSDVPRTGLEPGKIVDRLPPGAGAVPFPQFFRALASKGYDGFVSYEAPNPAAWGRDPETVAREALAATRVLLPGA